MPGVFEVGNNSEPILIHVECLWNSPVSIGTIFGKHHTVASYRLMDTRREINKPRQRPLTSICSEPALKTH